MWRYFVRGAAGTLGQPRTHHLTQFPDEMLEAVDSLLLAKDGHIERLDLVFGIHQLAFQCFDTRVHDALTL